jgi:hypothetical protein
LSSGLDQEAHTFQVALVGRLRKFPNPKDSGLVMRLRCRWINVGQNPGRHLTATQLECHFSGSKPSGQAG